MKEFLRLLRRFVPPYKKYLVRALFLNLLPAILNVFSFALIIPILQTLFKTDAKTYGFIPQDAVDVNLRDTAVNNFYYYVTELIASQGGSLTLLILGIFLTVMILLKALSYFASPVVIIPFRTGVVRDIRAQIYNRALHLPLSFFSEERKGDITARMSGDVTEVGMSVTSSLDMLIKNPILIIAYFRTLITIGWQLTLFTLLVLPDMGWITGTMGRKLKRQSLDTQAKWSDTMSRLEETLGGLRIIKAFIAENKMMECLNRCGDEYRDAINRVATRQVLAYPMSEFLGTCVIVIVLWFDGILTLSSSSTINTPLFIYYLVVLCSVINLLKEFSKAGYNTPKGLASMGRIGKVLFAENPIKEPARPKPLPSLKDKVEFKDISFSYDDSRQMLKHIDLTMPKGKTTALVGQSGSGKSTLVDLPPRYHDVQSGEIRIGGLNIKEMRISDLCGPIGDINQEAIFFSDTFFNDIAFGVENVTMEQVVEAAKTTSAHDFIMDAEKGYNTNTGDRGGKLSGGQRQRISIARAILKNPPILIPDEVASTLDTEPERLMQEALERSMKTRTTIAIAHRPSTIESADEICVLYEGEIMERGKHEEPLAENGYYKKLNDVQSLG